MEQGQPRRVVFFISPGATQSDIVRRVVQQTKELRLEPVEAQELNLEESKWLESLRHAGPKPRGDVLPVFILGPRPHGQGPSQNWDQWWSGMSRATAPGNAFVRWSLVGNWGDQTDVPAGFAGHDIFQLEDDRGTAGLVEAIRGWRDRFASSSDGSRNASTAQVNSPRTEPDAAVIPQVQNPGEPEDASRGKGAPPDPVTAPAAGARPDAHAATLRLTGSMDARVGSEQVVRGEGAAIQAPDKSAGVGSFRKEVGHSVSFDADVAKAAPAIRFAGVSDGATANDEIGFKPYVEAVAEFLSNKNTTAPLAMSVEGEWGSGKSSFMLQLEEALKKRGQKHFVRFNAWRFEKDEALWASFALEFARQVKPSWTYAWALRLLLGLRRVWQGSGRWPFVKALLGLGVLGLGSNLAWSELEWLRRNWEILLEVAAVALSIPAVKYLRDFFGNPFGVSLSKLEGAPDYEGRVPFLQQFHDDFDLLLRTYVPKGRKVFVFVDDLDRCEVPKAAELLQALNLLVPDKSNLVFIFGVDVEKVAAGIAIRHEKLLPLVAPPKENSGKLLYDPQGALEFGRSFLERFLQIPFVLPKLGANGLEPLLDAVLGAKGKPEAGAPHAPLSTTNAPDVVAAPAAAAATGGSEPPRPLPRDAEALVSPEARQARKRQLEFADSDSAEVRDVMRMVAPVFGFNPRRLKQFLNIFRLSAYIASETGLFDPDGSHNGGRPLSLRQVGKFVALNLRWPSFIRDASVDRRLIETVAPVPAGSGLPPAPWSDEAKVWAANAPLVRLLLEGADHSAPYYLTTATLERLNVVTPAVSSPISMADSAGKGGAAGLPSDFGRELYNTVAKPQMAYSRLNDLKKQ